MAHVSGQTKLPNPLSRGLALHAVLSKKRSVNPWKMAINRYSGGINLPNLIPALAGKQLVYKRAATTMHEKMNTSIPKARAAFQLASITTVSGYP
jgi:hypothetical protein